MTLRPTFVPALSSLLVALVLSACGGGKSETGYANDGDTGAAAPATVRDMSATPNVGDSTTASRPLPGAYPTNLPAGDTLKATGTGATASGAAGAAGGAGGSRTRRP